MSNSNSQMPGSYAGDFREPAVYESQRIVAEHRNAGPAGGSLCLPTGVDPAYLRRYGRWVLMRFLVGMAGIAGGAFMGMAFGRRDHAGIWVALAAGASIGGIAVLLSNNFFMGRFTRRHLGQRFDELLALPHDGRPKLVSIENAHSFSKLKIVPEDMGYLVLDASTRTLTIEGVMHRYVIRGEDVLEIEQQRGGNTTATTVTYAVGRAELSIALTQASIGHEVKKQTIGAKRDPLLESLQAALGHEELEVLD
ncbi:MAG: hypothetical protein WD845_16025 [Pirellulales bacterium]